MNLNLNGEYSFFIKDINAYPGFIDRFFKWKYPLIINISFNKNNFFMSNLLLQELGFEIY